MPKISIIIPVYGVEKYIERCCVSVFEQTYRDFEVIFINDCTKDNSELILLEVMKRYQHLNITTQIIRHEVNKGISAARETGLNAATGEYILYIDSDDYIDTNMLAKMMDRASITDADITYCDYYEVMQGRQRYIDQSLPVNQPALITAAMLRQEIVWCPWNKLFKKKMVIEHNIHWPEGINIGEDLVVMAQLFCFANKIEHVNEALYFYNRDNVNSYLNAWSLSSCNQNTRAVEWVDRFLKQHDHHAMIHEAFTQTKLMARYQMLYTFDKQLIKLAADTFTETNSKVFTYKFTPYYWRLALYLVAHKQRMFADWVLNGIGIVKSIKRNITLRFAR